MGEHTDVLVVGGGPAGLAMAIDLAPAGCRVVVIDAGMGRAASLGEHLAPAARHSLNRLGVWDRFHAGPHLPCYARLSAWGGSELNEQSSMQNPYGAGWIIDRGGLELMLRQRAQDLSVRFRRGRIVACQRHGARWALAATGGRSIDAAVVIDATGRRCSIVRATGGSVCVVDRLVAVSSHFRRAAPATGPCPAPLLVESVPSGWWYSAEVPSETLIAVFVTDPATLGSASAGVAWSSGLSAAPHTRLRLAGWTRVGPLSTHSAGVQRAVPPSAAGCVAVGDASLALDPLSGSGLRIALETSPLAAAAATSLLNGETESAAAHSREVDDRLTVHLTERAMFYAIEHRWRDLPFWARRIERSELLSAPS